MRWILVKGRKPCRAISWWFLHGNVCAETAECGRWSWGELLREIFEWDSWMLLFRLDTWCMWRSLNERLTLSNACMHTHPVPLIKDLIWWISSDDALWRVHKDNKVHIWPAAWQKENPWEQSQCCFWDDTLVGRTKGLVISELCHSDSFGSSCVLIFYAFLDFSWKTDFIRSLNERLCFVGEMSSLFEKSFLGDIFQVTCEWTLLKKFTSPSFCLLTDFFKQCPKRDKEKIKKGIRGTQFKCVVFTRFCLEERNVYFSGAEYCAVRSLRKLEMLGSIVSRLAHYDACVNLSTLCKHRFFLARNMLSRSSCWGS